MPTTINQVYFRKWRRVAGFSIHKRQKTNKVAKSEMKRNSENTPSCKRIIFVAYGSTMIKALRQSKCPNLTQIGDIFGEYTVLRIETCVVYSLSVSVRLCTQCFLLGYLSDTSYQKTPKDRIKLQIDPYLYYRHLCHCSNFICRYRVQISCFTFDFKR